MIANSLIFLLLPVAAASGWLVARKSKTADKASDGGVLPKNYFVGLNLLLNEQHDKAVDIFIKMLDVDNDTVETHLALGNHFRRRGEVDRAIRIHQNLIARPNLHKKERCQALLELGRDYMRAGVLDRAERLLLEQVETGEFVTVSLRLLLDIYQQEKDWLNAIQIAQRIESETGRTMSIAIAHHYCELAIEFNCRNQTDQAEKHLKRALSTDKNCVRASLMLGDMEFSANRIKSAMRFYKRVVKQDADYISEAIKALAKCYEYNCDMPEFVDYLSKLLVEYSHITIVLYLAEQLAVMHDERYAANFITQQLHKMPSLQGVQSLVKFQIAYSELSAKEDLQVVNGLLELLLRDRHAYQCINCGMESKHIHWLCPSCKRWSAIKPIHCLEGD